MKALTAEYMKNTANLAAFEVTCEGMFTLLDARSLFFYEFSFVCVGVHESGTMYIVRIGFLLRVLVIH
jgi:hypothetical protein